MKSETVVAVVIPFYQREQGILPRALKSVLSQTVGENIRFRIVIVDDESPVPPDTETIEQKLPGRHNVEIVKQKNGGPGAARNRALDMLDPDEVDFVAFLDSDDEWQPNHIRDAIDALSASPEHGFYFCDHTRFNTTRSWFEESELFQKWKSGEREPAPLAVAGLEQVFVLPSDDAFSAFLEEYLSQTSTVVYRFPPNAQARFDTELRSAGEDHMLWITIARDTNVVFSAKRNVACGQGVNVYFSAFDWDLPQTAERYGYLVLFLTKVARNFQLTGEDAQVIDDRLTKFSKVYAYLLGRNLLKGRKPNSTILGKISRLDPKRVLSLPALFVIMLKERRSGNWDW
ncbi:MAG: glycosyltransferase family A protein [Phyllobacterium sp.]